MSVDDPQSAAENSYTFVLVHGGCHDGSLWQPVIERLEQLGHTAYGPTVAGHGKDVPKNVTHAESTQSIVDFIVDRDLTDFVLVGHGYAGTIISKVVGTADMVMPPGDSGWHPRMSCRLGKFRLVQMSGSHEAVFTNPIGLADKFIEAGRD